MNLKDEDLSKATRLIAQQIENATCAECCKYYIVPETAHCGHTLCHTCWRGRLNCAFCAKPIERHSLKHNKPLQELTDNIHALSDAFEVLFNIKVPECLIDAEPENEMTKNVRDWLASSQNHFSGPPQSSERSSQEMVPPNLLNVSCDKIQIHTNTSKTSKKVDPGTPEKVVYVRNIPQDDWDKIEPMPETEDIGKGKENVIGPMDIEPFYIDEDNEYTVSNPRRSSRKRELKPDEKTKTLENKSLERHNSKDSIDEIDKKSNKAKQHWINVKRMKKEFSKLNKKNRSKLNVSIEMCKKTQSTAKTLDVLPQAATFHYDIDENTPENLHSKEISKDHNINVENENPESNYLPFSIPNVNANNENQNEITPNSNQGTGHDQSDLKAKSDAAPETNKETRYTSHNEATKAHGTSKNSFKLPFYKKSSLHPKSNAENDNETTNVIKTTHHVVDSNANANDDIEITIKVANTVANILIKRKNDMELKMKTDREIQTSLDPHDIRNSSKNIQDQNIVINVGENHEMQVNTQTIANPKVEELKKVPISDKSGSEKKNTDSADTETATVQFEITESVEKELSKIMDFEEHKEIKSKSNTSTEKKKKTHEHGQSQKSAHPNNEYLNDLDIFDSEAVKESDVQLLKNTEHAPSEILFCTNRTRNKTQKVTQKRRKSISDNNTLPKSKKGKFNHDVSESKQNQPESESITYDAIMGTVFAKIDADIEETRQSQNIKNTYTLNDNEEIQQQNCTAINKDKSQDVALSRTLGICQSSQINDNCNNQKDSENIFSIGVEKENENVETAALASSNKKMHVNVPPSNVEDFLTPVMSQAPDNDDQMNDDSDKSVVEETPQKTSFTKIKQKSNGVNKESNQSQRVEVLNRVPSNKNPEESANINSIINLTDTSMKSNVDVTTVKKADMKSTETPLTINKFVNHIHHNSTPLAKKSLNFESEVEDLTLCPTNEVAKTTQEREFMIKAFEKTPTAAKTQNSRSLTLKHNKFIIAGSCLTSAENENLKKLCARNKWVYVDKYNKDLTHLVVSVDHENKAQRSIKYMCALASSKWIVSYDWVKKSIHSKDFINEEPYEVLDSTGDPGPRRSRLATNKLFQGISFFCLEPYSVLDVVTLKGMIESAGGRVVENAKLVRVTSSTTAPALLLAEPEDTQEDRFTYLAMELSIVPLHYEWALNCLGTYSLTSIYEHLQCPVALLPPSVQTWPQEMLTHDDDD